MSQFALGCDRTRNDVGRTLPAVVPGWRSQGGLESKLAGQQAAFTELQERDRRTTNDLREMERRVDQFKEVVRGEGRRQAAGVEASAKQVPKPFDDEQGRKNRAEIEALKQNIALVTGHTPEIFATGGM